MIQPLISNIKGQFRDALNPTLLALLWLSFLLTLKHVTHLTTEQPSATWPVRARSSLDASYPGPSHPETPISSTRIGAISLDTEKLWKDCEWAAYRIMTSLSTVTGLLLAFRSNSAIDRWSTARRKWSDVQATSRSLLRLLSTSLLPQLRNDEEMGTLEQFAEKQSKQAKVEATLATIPFFSISLMCQMRGLALPIPPSTTLSTTSSNAQQNLLRGDLLDRLPPALIALANVQPSDPTAQPPANKAGETERQKQLQNLNSPHIIHPPTRIHPTSTNLALTSLVLLQQNLNAFHGAAAQQSQSSASLSGPVYAHSIGLLNGLSGHMTELERVRDTPIPLAVSKHFSRLLAIHTCLLPVVVVQRLGERWWLCAAIVAVVTSMMYGVDSFAARLGQPMGLDREDLPLEKYVADVQREWDEVRASCVTLAV